MPDPTRLGAYQQLLNAARLTQQTAPTPGIGAELKALPFAVEVYRPMTQAQIRFESGGNPQAISPKGAIGLMQIMPSTGEWMANQLGFKSPNLTDPKTNIYLGEKYMDYLRQKFGRDDLALAAYNWGEGNLTRNISTYGQARAIQKAPRETRRYIQNVLNMLNSLKVTR